MCDNDEMTLEEALEMIADELGIEDPDLTVVVPNDTATRMAANLEYYYYVLNEDDRERAEEEALLHGTSYVM
jgi:hypothetical protein